MAKKTTCETGFTLTIFRGITVNLPWTWEDADGLPTDLTGMSVVFKLKHDDTVLEYTSVANTHGSVVTVTDAAGGEFTVLITDEETTSFEFDSGRWWLELHDGSGNIDLMWRDDFIVEDV